MRGPPLKMRQTAAPQLPPFIVWTKRLRKV